MFKRNIVVYWHIPAKHLVESFRANEPCDLLTYWWNLLRLDCQLTSKDSEDCIMTKNPGDL